MRKMFEGRSKPTSTERTLDFIKSLDPNKFSPCRGVPKQHIKRPWLITKLYKAAYIAYPVSGYTPIGYGWKLSKCGNYIEINWFEGDQISNEEMFNKYDEDSDENIYESDETDNDDGSDYDDF